MDPIVAAYMTGARVANAARAKSKSHGRRIGPWVTVDGKRKACNSLCMRKGIPGDMGGFARKDKNGKRYNCMSLAMAKSIKRACYKRHGATKPTRTGRAKRRTYKKK